jgi:coenzyme F420-reducing hydrogenase alpha subunit
MATRTIEVGTLARVEGEGALYVKVRDGRLEEVLLRIFEPPRYFEAFLRGRDFREAPDITARICGICPVAYQMSAVHAMEDALGVTVGGALRALRRLLYCGEWIESHALHVFMLHAPDFLGYPDAIRMAADHPEIVRRGLRLKKAGNEIMALVGGREIHPVNVRVGGFYKLPERAALAALRERLLPARDEALETVRWAARLDFPDFEQDYEFIALRHPEEYPFNEGRVVSSRGLDIAAREFEQHFVEEQVPHSNALHCVRWGGGAYLVGPLARYSLNSDRLSPLAREAAAEAGLGRACRNPFRSIVVRAVEIVYAFDEAIRLIEGWERPEAAALALEPRAAEGFACTEAPRGLLYHRYRIGADGRIEEAKIVPPTSQNQKRIEQDLAALIPGRLGLEDDALRAVCEQAIRNHDPCISCATHFLRLEVERR